jgi:hypothetical protein
MTLWNGRASALALALAAAVLCAVPASAAENKPAKETASFGTLRSTSLDDARAQAEKWLKDAGKFDEKAFKAVWDSPEKPLIDKLGDTFALADDNAAKLLKMARDPEAAAPEAVPAYLKDAKVSPYVRANLSLSYAKALASRKVYEDALEALRLVKAEQVVDPSAYYFNRAVCEHGLMLQPEATDTIARLLDDVSDVPERYKMVAALMHFDMLSWQDQDLGWIARKMDIIQRRLNLTRGGEKTQKIQREVVVRLNEMIKELENKKKDGAGSSTAAIAPTAASRTARITCSRAARSTIAGWAASPAPAWPRRRSSRRSRRSGASYPKRSAPRPWSS